MVDGTVVAHEPILVTLSREKANELLEEVVEQLSVEMAEVQRDHFFDPTDPHKTAALRKVVKLAALAGDLL